MGLRLVPPLAGIPGVCHYAQLTHLLLHKFKVLPVVMNDRSQQICNITDLSNSLTVIYTHLPLPLTRKSDGYTDTQDEVSKQSLTFGRYTDPRRYALCVIWATHTPVTFFKKYQVHITLSWYRLPY